MATRLSPGAVIARRELVDVRGARVPLPDPDGLVHLQFRRFAGCPVCHLHLRTFARRAAEVEAAGIREVVFFHAPAEELRPHVDGLPFAVIPDPDRTVYAELGVESSARSLLSPRAWWPILRAVAVGLWHMARGRQSLPALVPHGGRLGLPADFLVGPDGRVLAARYGEHVDDQWSVDDLLEEARAARNLPAAAPPRSAAGPHGQPAAGPGVSSSAPTDARLR